ncbi:hypothetical protein ACIBG8_36575 [Nonomuraea sp. NPDC050556]|uniref:caspase, EACC1-associated type n=1 Tax=Nonomuraea sp. NPDC050556 TaxID=3364369 RepID=UPI0037AF02C1
MTVFGRLPGATALLLGTSVYTTLPDVPAVATTVTDLAQALVRRSGLSPEAVHVATELSGPEQMGDAIAAVAESAQGPILVSFSGHGLVSPTGTLYLATARTDPRRSRLEHTALPYDTLRRYLLDSAARPVIVLLDCCFSGWAVSAMGPSDDVAGLTEIDGAFVVTASGRSEMALAPEGDRHTAFGGALLRLLEHGDPHAPAALTLQAVHRHLSTALPAAGFPRPRCRSSGTAGELVLAPNPARAAQAVSPSRRGTLGVHDGPPYQGLAPFDRGDGALFFGRDSLVTQLLRRLARRLDDPRPLVVTGASGSGKSSLLRAGLLPAIARGGLEVYGSASWSSVVLTPTADPLGALERASGHRVVVIDQFEELFTECGDEGTRAEFVARLNALSASALVVLCVRADFYGRCAAYPQLAVAMGDGQVVVGPMSPEELREVVVRPAELAGLTLEPGLVELLLADLGARYEAGRLPLLSHALLATWQGRSGDELTVAGYRETGGIHGALAATADRTLAAVGDRRAARALMRRLVHVGEGMEDTRRRVDRDLMLADVPAEVVEAFAAERLVTVDEEHVQLTHEALIHAWPTLRAWIDEDRAGALVEQHLLDAALAWERDHRDPSGLYRGARLALALEWTTAQELAPLTTEFLEASAYEENAAARATRRRVRLLRNLAASLAALLLVTLAATGLAVRQTATAAENRDLATARKTAALADTLRTSDPRTAMLLSVAAWRLAPVDEARAALYSSLAQRELHVFPAPQVSGAAAFALSPDGSRTAAVDRGAATVWDVDSERALATLTGLDPTAQAAAISQDGRTLAVGGERSVRLWDIASGRPVGPAFGSGSDVVEFSATGRRLLTRTLDDHVQVWDTGSLGKPMFDRHDPNLIGIGVSAGDRLHLLVHRDRVEVLDASFHSLLSVPGTQAALSPDGARLTVSQGVDTRLWDVRTGKPTATLLRGAEAAWIGYSADGRYLMTWGSGGITLWTATGERLLGQPVDDVSSLEEVRIDARDQRLTYKLGRGALAIVDVSRSTGPLPLGTGVKAAALAGDRRLAVVNASGVRLGDPRNPEAGTGGTLGTSAASAVALTSDGALLAVAEPDKVTLWDATRGVRSGVLQVGGAIGLAFSHDDSKLAVAVYTGEQEAAQVWDVRAMVRMPIAAGPADPAMAFLPDGRSLAIGGVQNSLTSLSGGGDLARPFGRQPRSVAVSDDGRLIATGNASGGVDLWDAVSRTRTGHLAAPAGQDDDFVRLAFSPDGNLLAAGGVTGRVRLWRVDSRVPLGLPYTEHAKEVVALSFSADGRELYSIAAGGGLQRHLVDADRAALAVCDRVHRTLSDDQWRRLIPETPPRKVC